MNLVSSQNSIRVNKTQARKLYNAGCEVVMVGCKMWPFGGWSLGYHVTKADLLERATYPKDAEFDQVVQNHGWYNLSYEEGYYQAFYVRLEDARHRGVPEHQREAA